MRWRPMGALVVALLWTAGAPAQDAARERDKARENAQARRSNKKGSFERPADVPAQRNRRPKAIGSGAPNLPPDQQGTMGGRNYKDRRRAHGRAGGIATGTDNPGA